MFLTADGESGKAGGNETIRVDEAGRLRIKIPAALADQFGPHLDDRGTGGGSATAATEWAARVAARRAVRYDITYDSGRGRWYLDASWKTSTRCRCLRSRSCAPARCWVSISTPITWPACVLDGSGNPVGDPITIAVRTAGSGGHRAVMGGCARRSPPCSIRAQQRTARRW